MRICFATNNAHKLDEVRDALVGKQITLLSLTDINCTDELPETRDTLEGNSAQKAEFVFERYDIACFADDTGLEVEALYGAPGVYSARYAGNERDSERNIDLLLHNLSGLTNRKAQFRTVITLLGFGTPIFFEGVIAGNITHSRIGKQGFGYDAVFVPEGFDKTFAEMTLQEKNQLSHRARAVSQLMKYLQSI